MIVANDLSTEQVYYLAQITGVEQYTYLATLPGTDKHQPVYFMVNHRRHSYRFYGVDLLNFYPTRQEALQAVIDSLHELTAKFQLQLDTLVTPTNDNN